MREKWSIPEQIVGLLSLARPVNAAIAFVSIAAAGVVAGVRTADWPLLALAGAAGALIGVAGNVLNDVFDVEIDKVNKPRRALAAGKVSRGAALLCFSISSALGIAGSFALGTVPLLISGAALALIALYNARLKRRPLLGNFIVAAVTGAAFLFGASAAGNIQAGIIPALLAFGVNLPREILKDVEDIAGDESAGVRTFPVCFGSRPALQLATGLIVLLMLASPLPYFLGIYSAAYLVLLLAGAHALLIVRLSRLRKHPTPEEAGRMAVAMKFVMLAGLAAIVAGYAI